MLISKSVLDREQRKIVRALSEVVAIQDETGELSETQKSTLISNKCQVTKHFDRVTSKAPAHLIDNFLK